MNTLKLAPILALLVVAAARAGAQTPPPGEPARPADGGARKIAIKMNPGAKNLVWFESLLAHPLVASQAVQLVPFPDHSQFFILSRNGDLYNYQVPLESLAFNAVDSIEATKKGQAFKGPGLRLKIDNVAGRADIGSIGMALDPKFDQNRFVYIWYADKPDQNVALDRFTWGPDTAAVAKSRVTIISFSREKPPKPYHMGGIVKFLADGTLLIASGDAEREELSQDRKNLNGKLLRIRPRLGPEGGYDVPDDNPHVGDPEWRPEIVASGIRAAFRGFVDAGKSLVFADVGAVFEEINVWTGGAANYGWGLEHNLDGPTDRAGTTKPFLWWCQEKDFSGDDPDFSGEIRMSAFAGLRYSGDNDRYQGLLTGKVIWGDLMRGWLRAGDLDLVRGMPTHEHIGHLPFVTDMVQGKDGYIYCITCIGPGRLYRMRLTSDQAARPLPVSSR